MTKEFKALKHRKIALSDEDAQEITTWEKVVVGKFYRPVKKQITVRIDADVLDWFRHAAKKYQPLINLACRKYMMHQEGLHQKQAAKAVAKQSKSVNKELRKHTRLKRI